MKKQRVSPTTNLTPSVTKESFRTTGNLPSPEAVERAVKIVTGYTDQQTELLKEIELTTQKLKMVGVTTERNHRKRETIKGTILQAVMIDKDLLKLVKNQAFKQDVKLSDVINDALKQYFQ